MTASRSTDSLSRRSALVGLSAAGAGLALSAAGANAAAQTTTGDMAKHPIVGAWLVAPRSASGGFDSVLFGGDGSVTQAFAASSAGQQGVTFSGPGAGIWEPIDDHTVEFTAVSAMSDASGAALGTVTVDGHLTIGKDGQSWVDDQSASMVTIRDKGGAVVVAIHDPKAPPVTATRIRIKAPGFPKTAAPGATPTP